MFERCFIFPGLKSLGYESGMSVPCPVTRARRIDLQISRYHEGAVAAQARLEIPPDCLQFRTWQSNWNCDLKACGPLDIFVARIVARGTDEEPPGLGELEAQMLFRHSFGWTSSLLTGFVPLRPPGYKFASIIHTGHYFADRSAYSSSTIFTNVRSPADGPAAGRFSVTVQSRDGTQLGQIERQIVANSALVVALDDVLDECGVGKATPHEGFNLTFVGGRSQFSIMTVFQRRDNGAIGLEHSLAPLYYIPQLRDAAVRSRVYGRIGSKA